LRWRSFLRVGTDDLDLSYQVAVELGQVLGGDPILLMAIFEKAFSFCMIL